MEVIIFFFNLYDKIDKRKEIKLIFGIFIYFIDFFLYKEILYYILFFI